MKSLVNTLGSSTETCLASIAIDKVELFPHNYATTAILGFVNNKARPMEVEIWIESIIHHREHLFLEALILVTGVYQRVRSSHVATAVHENVLLSTVPMEVAVDLDFPAL